MNHEIENFKSSQISPNFEVHKNSKVLSGLYTQMLLDDFCRSYSIEFSVDKNRQCFYDISPVGDTLKSIFHSFRVKVALLRYIVFSFESGCDTSEPQVSYISRACSSLVRQPYHIPNRFLLKISGLETILATKKGRWDGRSFYMDEYTLIFLFS